MWNLDKGKNRIALLDESENKVSYSDLRKFTESLSKQITKRSLVLCLCSNSLGSIVGYVSFLNAKIIPLMLEKDVDELLLSKLIEVYEPDYFWIPKELSSRFTDTKAIYSEHQYVLLKSSYNTSKKFHQDLAMLLSTSGSTGSKKLVRLSYENISSNSEAIVDYLEINQDDRTVTTLPMSYSYGLSIINSYLEAFGSIVITDKGLVQKEFWNLIKDKNVTSFGGVPFTYEMLHRLKFFQMELPSLKVLTQAGGKLRKDLVEKFAEFSKNQKKNFFVMYGQTEASPRISYVPHEKSVEKSGSIGIPIPGGRLFLLDKENKKIKDSNIEGELIYQGKNVCLGYAESSEDLALGDIFKGTLFTGDLAKVDKDGFYWVTGRKKRFIKVYGHRVNLDEIEQLLKDKFHNFEIACTGIDDKIYIFVTEEMDHIAIKQFINSKTGLNMSSVLIMFINEIPKNESGKPTYMKLNDYIE